MAVHAAFSITSAARRASKCRSTTSFGQDAPQPSKRIRELDRARCAAGAVAGRAAPPLFRLFAGPGLPARRNALLPEPRELTPGRGSRRRHHPRAAAERRRSGPLPQEPGSHVGKRSEHLIVRKDGAEIQRVPIAAIRQVVVFGNVQVSTQALECLATLEVPVVYMTGYGRFIAALQPAPTKNVHASSQPVSSSSPTRSGAGPGQGRGEGQDQQPAHPAHASLRYRAFDEPSTNDSIRGSDEPAARDMADLLTRLDRVSDPAVLLGTEGQAAALYFSQFGRMLKAPCPDESSTSRRATAGRRGTR